MGTPLVTVVIPVFNRGECVLNALSSIQQQTWTRWEALIVDDGSTDGSDRILQGLHSQDSRVRVVRHVRNRGAQAARNTGIGHARGEWVAFLDSDDVWLPQSLEARLKLAVAQKVQVVHSTCDVIDTDGVTRPYGVPPIAGRAYKTLLQKQGPLFQALLVTKEALRTIGGLDDRIVAFQEWDAALSLAKHYEFGFVPDSTFVYDCRRSDTISKNMLRGAIGYEQVFHKRYFDILRYSGPGTLASHYRTAAQWYQAAGATSAVRRCELMRTLWSCLDVSRIACMVSRTRSQRIS